MDLKLLKALEKEMERINGCFCIYIPSTGTTEAALLHFSKNTTLPDALMALRLFDRGIAENASKLKKHKK